MPPVLPKDLAQTPEPGRHVAMPVHVSFGSGAGPLLVGRIDSRDSVANNRTSFRNLQGLLRMNVLHLAGVFVRRCCGVVEAVTSKCGPRNFWDFGESSSRVSH